MLSLSQKAKILCKSGSKIPPFPSRRLPVQERHLMRGARAPQEELEADEEQEKAVKIWSLEIESMYVAYVAARAAQSLREAEVGRQSEDLRGTNAGRC